MTTEHATSDDGVDWTWHGTALAGRPGEWDARGVRVAAVRLDGPRPVAWYDGRATAEQNWEEQTGLATIDEPGHLTAVGTGPAGVSPYGLGGSAVRQPGAAPGRQHPVLRRGHPTGRCTRPAHGSGASCPFLSSSSSARRRPARRPCTWRWPGTRGCSCPGSRSPSTSSPTGRPRRAVGPGTRRPSASTSGAAATTSGSSTPPRPARCAASPRRSTCTTTPPSSASSRRCPRPG